MLDRRGFFGAVLGMALGARLARRRRPRVIKRTIMLESGRSLVPDWSEQEGRDYRKLFAQIQREQRKMEELNLKLALESRGS